MADTPAVLEMLSDEECDLYAILSDISGLDQAEFLWYSPDHDYGCFRAWPYQWSWWRTNAPLQIDQSARALSLDTPIPTPDGWTTMGELRPGDQVFDENGQPTDVTAISQVWTNRDCYEVCFDDHTSIVADAEHLWMTWDKKARGVRTTKEILDTLIVEGEQNHSIDVAGPLQAGDKKLPLDPYFLGYWLGNGDDMSEVPTALRQLGVVDHEHIPQMYLRASEAQRWALLAGLFDSSGHIQANGSAEVTQKASSVAEGLLELLRSLGEKPRLVKETAYLDGIDCGPVYRVTWRPRQTERTRLNDPGQRRIVDVRQVPTRPVRCITVDSPTHLFLAGAGMVPTHNSVGKSLSIKVRAFAFPLLWPGNEMVITAPELVHLEPIVSLVEQQIHDTRLTRELLQVGRSAVTHRPFQANFVNGARIIGRIPQRDGRGVKGCCDSKQLIVTASGFKEAIDVAVGDKVLTHAGEWQEVRAVEYDENDCYEVRGAGSFPMVVSCDHRFLGAENTATPKQKRNFLPLAWHDVERLTDHQIYWATPTQFPELPVPACGHLDMQSVDFWWLVGRYLADGWADGKRVIWTAPKRKQPALFAVLDALGLHYYVTERDHSTADNVTHCSVDLNNWLLEHFGKLAVGKQLPPWALGMDVSHRQALLEGYLAGDGWFEPKKKRWEVGTASKPLAVGVQLLAQSLGYTVGCTIVEKPKSNFTDNALPSYRLHIGHGVSVEVDGYLVGKVKSVEPVGKRKVVNIITDDHSYLSGSIMSHNIHPVWLEMDECFSAGTLVLTERGLVPIEQVVVGDVVLTHRNRWRRVTDVFERQPQETYEVSGYGSSLQTTENHKFWIRELQGGRPRDGLKDADWKHVRDLGKGDYWALPTSVAASGDDWFSSFPLSVTRTDAAWLIGRYCADGTVDAMSDGGLATWLAEHCGRQSSTKRFPLGLLAEDRAIRAAVFAGYTHGDGYHVDAPETRVAAVTFGSTSKPLAIGMQLLAQTLGWSCSRRVIHEGQKVVNGHDVIPLPYHRVDARLNPTGPGQRSIPDDDYRWGEIYESRGTGRFETHYDLTVEEDHSFVADGVVVSNSQDYPHAGWVELTETLKRGHEGAVWRAHGVTRGVRDDFYEHTQDHPDNEWTVHRYPAMYRPNWSDQERTEKIKQYGSRDDPDYRRNVLGLHGDATNPMFVLSRLMKCWVSTSKVSVVEDGALVLRQIDSITPGTKVLNSVGVGEVVAVTPSEHARLITLTVNGERLTCSMDHLLLTSRGWAEAQHLREGDELVRHSDMRSLFRAAGSQGEEVSLPNVHGGRGDETQEVLLAAVCGEIRWSELSGIGYSEADIDELRSLRDRVRTGSNENQSGPCASGQSDGGGSRWPRALGANSSGVGPSSRRMAPFARVESVEVLEPGDPEFDRLSGGKDYVECYDLTVSGHPSFCVGESGLLVHNCVDDEEHSEYNEDEYFTATIKAETLALFKQQIEQVMDYPSRHKSYLPKATYWAGMDVGYCVTPDTEIFTDRGWLRWDEVTTEDRSLGVNPTTGMSEWQEIRDVYREKFDSIPMTRMKGRSFDAETTPHHRWLVRSESGAWRWRETRTLNSKDCVPLAVPRADLPIDGVYSNEFVELVAWFWTEGYWISKTSAGIAQSGVVNAPYVERIRHLLKVLCGEPGPAYAPGIREVVCQWVEDVNKHHGGSDFRFRGPVVAALRSVMNGKVPTVDFLRSLTAEQLALYIETSIDADGWRTASGARKIEQRSEQGIRSFEIACALAGLPTSTNYERSRDRYHLSILGADTVRPMKAAQFPRSSGQAMTIENVNYSGHIWCPTVTHGNWLARKNGSVYFTGNTTDPSEIVVFVEYRPKGAEKSVLKLLSRTSLQRISHGEQVRAILHTIDFYRPKVFAMDRTGLGLPLFKDIQEQSEDGRAPRNVIDIIKGYNFSEKITVGFDDAVEVDEYKGDLERDAGIRRSVLEYASDTLRTLVDETRLALPWDSELLKQFQGSTWTSARGGMDQYGRRTYSKGNGHILDAARMAVLGWVQYAIEETLKKPKDDEPVLDWFVG